MRTSEFRKQVRMLIVKAQREELLKIERLHGKRRDSHTYSKIKR